ncbi:MAG TPA: 5-formyltetrahydrofolate cyclo-ligase [Burkholderiales bacterium]|nr:5-formyltetrahydrofolate cyclo-ligase [Burkholderiales bacterium]
MNDTFFLRKKELRESVLGKRDALDRQTLAEAGKLVCGRLCSLPEYVRAKVVLAYTPFRSEMDTLTFLSQVLHDGKTLLLPRVNKLDKTLSLYQVKDLGRDLVPGAWGIIEPDPGVCPQAQFSGIDFILVPGSVFDLRGGRMGYGAGFYDRLLASLEPRPFCVGAALDLQMVDEVPMEPHDLFLDLIVTPTSILKCGR